ncbi:MAG: hypothetical protein PT977_07700 [Acidobacteriota bacterium]|nr:hypothetical protein [Acidobacteriota bacterium]
MTVYVDDSELRTAAALAVKRDRDCPVITARSACRIEPRPNSTLAELTQSAGEILLGRIVTQHPGLLIGQPGTLLEVAVEQSLKGKPPDRVFLFYPRLRAILGAAVVCHQDAGFRLAPRTGDRVVFFSWEKPLNRSGTLFMPEPTEMIFADAAGDLRGPARRDQYPSELKTLDDLVVAIGHALGR